MATEVLNKPGGTEDDEEWLYGGTSNVENKEPESLRAVSVGEVPAQTGGESGGLSSADQSQEKFPDDDDDSDDEDDVQVTIGDIKAFPVSDAGNRMFKGPAYQKGQAGQKPGATGPGVKGVDPDAEGIVNGVSVFEFNLDTLKDEEKPWRKPGADITDYFNYGFNEDSWKQYCSKQNRLRAENGLSVPKFPSSNQPTFIRVPSTNPVVSSGAPPVRFIPHQPHYIQPVTNAGAIAVIGSTAASRRPADEDIQTIGTIGTETINTEIDIKPDIGLPPPHGMPPVDMPPPDYSVPPPGMPPVFPNIPPPGMNVPPPMFNPPPAYYPPPHGAPPHVPPPDPRFPDQPPFGFEPPSQNPGYPDPKAPWDSRERDSYRDKYDYGKKRDKSPGSGYSSEGSEDYRYSRSSDRRDYYDRDYSRSRDGRRSRSRSRSRSRDRRHRERDDKHKSKSRKIKTEPDDSDYYKSSKHKKSKKSKRDKGEDDYSPSRPSRDEDVPSVPS